MASRNGAATSADWLRRYSDTRGAAVRLVCFPHAGGAANFFRSWPDALGPRVDVVAVQYPGRHDRMGVPCEDTMAGAVTPIAHALAEPGDRPTVFFGHSMGAAIAFEVALELERGNGPAPREIVVSAREAPDSAHRRPEDFRTDEDIIAEVRRLGGVSAELIDNEDFRSFAMPALRGDFRLITGYRPDPARAVRAALTAYVGDRDPDLSEEDMRAWAKYTTGDFACRVFPGDHFYLAERPEEVLADLALRLVAERTSEVG
jgi:pyochelin biosynthetic protein PchC